MTFEIRRLAPGDEGILEYLAINDAEFEIDGRGEPQTPLERRVAQKYLSNEAVHFWVAFDGEAILGALMNHMEHWMRANDINEVWVGADNQGAVEFYNAFGFAAADANKFLPVYLTRKLGNTRSITFQKRS